ncbi:MAG TPA: histone deacetylase [Smithellaceae bacterium]|nr:histone deacetylase [Smithellaceae bacterium]
MSRNVGIVKDRRYLQHTSGASHPESPERLAPVYEMLDNPDTSWKYAFIDARSASHDELAYVHTQHYIDYVASTAGKDYVILDPDTITCPETYEIAKLAAGGACNAVDAVLTGEVDNAFALVRPPGHHASAANSAGFCIFNNVAIAALHARYVHNVKRILIVDWDLHHGNGTQKTFYADREVLFFSTHQYPYYPGTGGMLEAGEGTGLGYTVNVPLNRGGGNATYVAALRKILLPIARFYNPELIMVSAGFDIYFKDPLGGMRVNPEGFAAMARILLNLADECCDGKLVAVLEGGYHVGGLTASVRAMLNEMSDETHCREDKLAELEKETDEYNALLFKQVITLQDQYWHVF